VTDTITERGGFAAPGSANDVDQADKPRRPHRRVNPVPEQIEPEQPTLPPSPYALSVANARRADLLRRLRVDLESLQLHGPRQVQQFMSAGMHALGARQAEQNRQGEIERAAEMQRVASLDGWALVVELAPAIAAELGYRG
jgi:hypothetical protein